MKAWGENETPLITFRNLFVIKKKKNVRDLQRVRKAKSPLGKHWPKCVSHTASTPIESPHKIFTLDYKDNPEKTRTVPAELYRKMGVSWVAEVSSSGLPAETLGLLACGINHHKQTLPKVFCSLR